MRPVFLQLGLLCLAAAFIGFTAWSLRYFGRYQPFADLVGGNTLSPFNQIGLEVNNATVAGRVQGHRRWRLAAQAIVFSRDRRVITVDGIHNGLLYDNHGEPMASLTVGHATYASAFEAYDSGSAGILQLTGGVHVSLLHPRGPTLQTQSLMWDAARNQSLIPGHVTATFPSGMGAVSGLVLQTNSLTWNAGQTVIHTPGQVTATFPDGAGFARGEDMTVDTKTGDLSLHRLHGTFRVPKAVQ